MWFIYIIFHGRSCNIHSFFSPCQSFFETNRKQAFLISFLSWYERLPVLLLRACLFILTFIVHRESGESIPEEKRFRESAWVVGPKMLRIRKRRGTMGVRTADPWSSKLLCWLLDHAAPLFTSFFVMIQSLIYFFCQQSKKQTNKQQ